MSAQQPWPEDRPPVTIRDGRIMLKAFQYYTPLRKVQQHVLEHPDEGLSLAHAASLASMDETYFSEYFQAKVKVNLVLD